MSKNHLKRMNAPKTWPIERKATVFITRPKPGPHSMAMSMPLSILLIDVLDLARSARGVRFILNTQEVLVNGTKQRRPDASAGLFDIVSFPATKTNYRIVINKLNRLAAIPVAGKDAEVVPCKITSKTLLSSKRLQLGFHNGRTLLVQKDRYKVGGTVLLGLDGKERAYFPFEQGAFVSVTGGKHVGQHGIVERLSNGEATVKTPEGEIETRVGNLFVLGKGTSEIKIE